jgi:hypothetical protein
MATELTLQTFAPRVGEAFQVDAGEAGKLDLVLESAEASPPGGEAQREPFRLLFRGPAEPLLPQATYVLENPSLGATDIFIVPIDSDDGGVSYEAIFA